MDHPNIAKVLEAGCTSAGLPFFVMELVKGIPITEFCDQNKLDTTERLELFIQVCNAIQHAHQKGIIHRDLKPSNVMVAMYDDRAVPKAHRFWRRQSYPSTAHGTDALHSSWPNRGHLGIHESRAGHPQSNSTSTLAPTSIR